MARQGTTSVDLAAVLLSLLAGIATGISYLFMEPSLAWCCLVPLFYALDTKNGTGAALCCALFGVITASIFLSWVIPVATRYSGGFTFYSVSLFGIAVLYWSLYCAAFGAGYALLHRRSTNRILSGVSIAALFVLLEQLRMGLFAGSPWLHYCHAMTQAPNGWIVQWAAIGGLGLITFVIVFWSYILAQWLRNRDAVHLRLAAAVIAVFFLGGAILAATGESPDREVLTVILLNDNFSAAMRWDDRTGDSLAAVLFSLNEEAVGHDPDLIVWSETAIPWRIEPDDDFIPAVLGITRRSGADHLMGIWSPSAGDRRLVHNSAYLVTRDGNITGRYDKTILLNVLERPLWGGMLAALPFVGASRHANVSPGASRGVITTGGARIGVLICNESLSERMYAEYAGKGATLLVVMSNDAWFESAPMRKIHFYASRVGALMSGRDVVVNSNRGISGIARGDGAIEAYAQSDTARVLKCEARLSSSRTVYSRIRDFTIPLFALLACMSLVIGRK